jgi:hypothetical protein
MHDTKIQLEHSNAGEFSMTGAKVRTGDQIAEGLDNDPAEMVGEENLLEPQENAR